MVVSWRGSRLAEARQRRAAALIAAGSRVEDAGCRPGQVCSPDPAVPRCSMKTRSVVWFSGPKACAAQVMPLSTALPNPASLPFHPAR